MKQEKEKKLWHQLDYGLLFIVFVLCVISLIAVYSATYRMHEFIFFNRQLQWYIIGFIVLFGSLVIDYRRLKDFSIVFYIIGIVLLLLVSFMGETAYGAKRWIEFGGFRLQPSEFMKLFLVIGIAHMLVKTKENLEQEKKLFKEDLWLTTKIAGIAIPPFLLIMKQPDLGTALVLIAIVAVMLLVAGISWRVIILMGTAVIGMISSLVFLYFVNFTLFSRFIEGHQLSRIYGWLDPYEHYEGFGFQLIQSMMAIGSGQLLGRGFSQGVQTQFVPELHTDFIFAIIGEEFGFVGASILISVYFILIYRLVHIALTCNDMFGSYLVAGVIGMIVFQVFQNIGMTIGLMPITGLALPFISYGGSALLTNMLAIGIVLNVHMRTKFYMFD